MKKIIILILAALALAVFMDVPLWAAVSAGPLFALGITLKEGNYLSDVILREGEQHISREKVTVLTGEDLAIGTVLGKITKAIGEPVIAGTGNGTVTDVVLGPLAQIGTYTIRCIAEAANGGTFAVFAPDGSRLDDAVVGAAYAGHIGFTINDGAEDFDIDDLITIEVSAGSGKVVQIDPAALDGSQHAYGILIDNTDATAADVAAVAIVRSATAKSTGLVWPDGIAAGAKATALAELEAKHITTREGV